MEDKVRVLRILEYVGPRSWIERMLAERSVKTKKVFRIGYMKEECFIREAVIGDYPEILDSTKIKEKKLIENKLMAVCIRCRWPVLIGGVCTTCKAPEAPYTDFQRGTKLCRSINPDGSCLYYERPTKQQLIMSEGHRGDQEKSKNWLSRLFS